MPENRGDKRIALFKPGQRQLSARHLNSLVTTVNRLSLPVKGPIQPVAKGKTPPVKILTLVAHNGDYLECQDENLQTVYVAKQYELRQTPFDGETIGGITYTYTSASEREATDGVDTEVQFITPGYVVDAEIYAVKVKGDTGVEDPDTNMITFLEMNQGRAWAYDPDA